LLVILLGDDLLELRCRNNIMKIESLYVPMFQFP
jgi:hypothetical protein